MKQKTIIKTILIFVAVVSSFAILSADGYFDKPKIENKILSVEPSLSNPIVLAQSTTSVKKPTVVKKAPVKKVTPKKKKVVQKKKSVNLNPPIITPATAPYSAKKR